LINYSNSRKYFGGIREELDLSSIISAITVVISLVTFGFQRQDLKKQAKYQRYTFTLQNELEIIK
jgi:hypothetical protein